MTKISPPVVYYHSIAPSVFSNWDFYFLTIRLSTFERQLAFLKDQGYESIFLDRWLDIRLGKRRGTGRELCLTVDDGYLDNWVYAFPVARKYGVRLTLFIAPECVDPRDIVRPNLEDVWNGTCQPAELKALGFASWPELKLMQDSGWVDIQSHTMSHDKYISSPRLAGFYYGGPEGVYPIWNARPEIKPFYMADPEFGRYLPLGTPLFEEGSAVVTRKHFPNPAFVERASELAAGFDLSDRRQRAPYQQKVMALYEDFAQAGAIISRLETMEDYRRRLDYEIAGSKKILEEKTGKPVNFLCWPHGDNTPETHALALDNGYLATSSGKMEDTAGHPDRIPRFGAPGGQKRWINMKKFHYKIASHYRQQPFYALKRANDLRHWLFNNN